MIQLIDPIHVGLDQEALIKNIILDVAGTRLGTGDISDQYGLNLRERMTWKIESRVWTVNWYRPNTHPIRVGESHVPDFDFWFDDRRLANLESKNWREDYRPLSLHHTKDKIISRVTGRPVELGNILVISELRCQQCDEQQILDLLRDHRFKVLLTHGQTMNPDDEERYRIIRNRLEPILTYIFNPEGPRPDWALFLIGPKSPLLTILVLSMDTYAI